MYISSWYYVYLFLDIRDNPPGENEKERIKNVFEIWSVGAVLQYVCIRYLPYRIARWTRGNDHIRSKIWPLFLTVLEGSLDIIVSKMPPLLKGWVVGQSFSCSECFSEWRLICVSQTKRSIKNSIQCRTPKQRLYTKTLTLRTINLFLLLRLRDGH